LGVSRTPVNDALQRLSAQGLIEIIPRKGTFVTRVTPRDVEHTYQLRQALEGKACELAVRNLNASRVDALRRVNNRLVASDLTMLDHLRINQEFHELIVQYSENGILLEAFRNLLAHMQILQAYFTFSDWKKYSPSIVTEHSQIIEALASNRPQDARNLVEEHIGRSMARLVSAIQTPMSERQQLETVTANQPI
jgi:DNA-binding GntR family transcriptional regulator